MTEKAKEYIQPYVRSLLKCIAHVEPGDDRYSHLEQYVSSNIWSDKFNAVDRHAVKKSFDGVIKKFFIHGHSAEAEKLQTLLDKYLSSAEWENDQQNDLQWSVLSLLLHLSYNPTGAASTELQVVQPPPVEKKDDFDWPAYLLEDQPDFISLGSGGSETEDECLSFDDELQGESSSLIDDITVSENEPIDGRGGGMGGLVSKAAVNESCREQIWTYIEGTMASAHKWLGGNVQLPWSQGCQVPSKFASANLIEFCDVGENEQPSMVMSEYRVLREVLCALHAPPDLKVTPQHGKGLFFTDHQRCIDYAQGTVAIPSLTKGSLQSHLIWIGSYVSMVRVIEDFIEEMSEMNSGKDDSFEAPQEEGNGNRLPPLTYEAYASALKEFLLSFKGKVLTVEEKVKSQGIACTLLSVAQELRPAFKELALIHRLHLSAVSCWRKSKNWLCSCRLLTVLYGALLSSCSDMCASVCLHLFMKTFQPYLEITHLWLTEGRLEDWREEFIISKNSLVCGDTENFWKEGFILHPYEDELLKIPENGPVPSLPLGLLHLIRDTVLPLGKNMEMLQRLDRLSEVQRSLPSFERSLYFELSSVLQTEMRDGTPDEDAVAQDTTASQSSTPTSDCGQSSLLESLLHGIESSKDCYLRMAFDDISCSSGKDSNLSRYSGKWGKRSLESWGAKDGIAGYVVPQRVEHWLGRLLDERHGMSGSIVRSLLLRDFSLTGHLHVVRKVFLMEEGDCMQHFCTYLFQQVERGEKWTDTLSLTNHLHECMSNRFPDTASNFSVLTSVEAARLTAPSQLGHSLLNQVDHIYIEYAIQWPVSIVLNAASMESYNAVFQFLLKVKWSLWSLQQLRFSELCISKGCQREGEDECPVTDSDDGSMPMSAMVHRLQLLRAWLLHFVGSVHAYLMGQVLHALGARVDEDLEAASDLDAIIQVHENYLELIYQQCLQTKNSEIIKMAITRVLDISMVLCHLWKQPANITPHQLYDMENQYIRHHVFLARVLENAMNRGFVDHLKALVSALVHSFPSH